MQTGYTYVNWMCVSRVNVSTLFVCSSGIDNNGSRQTEVVNKQEEFLPPTPLLSVYLEQLSWEQDLALFPLHGCASRRSPEKCREGAPRSGNSRLVSAFFFLAVS